MSVRFMDGFERYGTSGNALGRTYGKWTSIASNGSGFNLTTGRYGGVAAQILSSNGLSQALIPYSGLGAASQLIFGFNFIIRNPQTSPSINSIPILSDHATTIAGGFRGITYNTNYSTALSFYNGGVNALNIPFTFESWHNLQVVISGTSGTLVWQFYTDGILRGTVNTTAGGNLIGFASYGGTNWLTVDDVFLLDDIVRGGEPTSRIPMDLNGAAPRIDTRFPNGDVEKTWASTTATAFDAVNDAPIDAMKFISIGGSETNQDFTIPALSTVNIPLASRIELLGRGEAGGTFQMRANDTVVSTRNAPAELATMTSDVISGYTLEELNSMTIGIAN